MKGHSPEEENQEKAQDSSERRPMRDRVVEEIEIVGDRVGDHHGGHERWQIGSGGTAVQEGAANLCVWVIGEKDEEA